MMISDPKITNTTISAIDVLSMVVTLISGTGGGVVSVVSVGPEGFEGSTGFGIDTTEVRLRIGNPIALASAPEVDPDSISE